MELPRLMLNTCSWAVVVMSLRQEILVDGNVEFNGMVYGWDMIRVRLRSGTSPRHCAMSWWSKVYWILVPWSDKSVKLPQQLLQQVLVDIIMYKYCEEKFWSIHVMNLVWLEILDCCWEDGLFRVEVELRLNGCLFINILCYSCWLIVIIVGWRYIVLLSQVF